MTLILDCEVLDRHCKAYNLKEKIKTSDPIAFYTWKMDHNDKIFNLIFDAMYS